MEPCGVFAMKLALFGFSCVNVCVQLRQHVCVSLQHALFGLCLTSYRLSSPRGALVSVCPCRAILPHTHTNRDLIGLQLHTFYHTRPYSRSGSTAYAYTPDITVRS